MGKNNTKEISRDESIIFNLCLTKLMHMEFCHYHTYMLEYKQRAFVFCSDFLKFKASTHVSSKFGEGGSQ